MYLFKLEFSPDICPGVRLLDHMVCISFLIHGISSPAKWEVSLLLQRSRKLCNHCQATYTSVPLGKWQWGSSDPGYLQGQGHRFVSHTQPAGVLSGLQMPLFYLKNTANIQKLTHFTNQLSRSGHSGPVFQHSAVPALRSCPVLAQLSDLPWSSPLLQYLLWCRLK